MAGILERLDSIENRMKPKNLNSEEKEVERKKKEESNGKDKSEENEVERLKHEGQNKDFQRSSRV